MQYYKFQYIFDEFSKHKKATKADEHDIGKIREKFTDIVDIVGIDIDLLRKHKDEETGDMISFDNSNRQFCFPEPICGFCVEVLMRYTDEDFKALRKREYNKVPIETLNFLIKGFTQFLENLGYDDDTIKAEKAKMDRRLNFNVSKRLFQLYTECQDLMEEAKNYTNNGLYDDKVYFIWYMVGKMKKLRDYLASVYGNYVDLRYEEADEFTMKESIAGINDDFQQTLILEAALKQGPKYQTLLNKQMEILCTQGFVKNLKSSYAKVTADIISIKQYEHELFGDKIQKTESVCPFTPKNPLDILYDAIQWTDETEQEQFKIQEKAANLTGEIKISGLSNEYFQHLPLSEFEQENQQFERKGTIKFACCDEEIIIYFGAAGSIITKCPRCGKQVLFNIENMSARIYETPKGQM